MSDLWKTISVAAAIIAPLAAYAQTTITPGQGSITDAQGNVWTISTDGAIKEGQTTTPYGGGTAALAIVNGTVFGKDDGNGPVNPGGWFTLATDGQSWTPAAAPGAASGSQVSGGAPPADPCITAPAAPAASTPGQPTFIADFNSIGPGGQWQPDYAWSANGYAAADMSSWFTNPATVPADANPFSTSGGTLTMAVKPTPGDASGAATGNQPYISGVMTTKNSFSQTYGYFQAVAQMPCAPGTMGAFWLLSVGGSWPPEIDIAEVLGNDPTMLSETAHTVDQADQLNNLTNTSNLCQGMHGYAVDWTADTITWYLDGQQVYQIQTPSDMHQPMYILLDTAAGTSGSWEGAPNGQAGAMTVSSVIVYASKPDGATLQQSAPAAAVATSCVAPAVTSSAAPVAPPTVAQSNVSTAATNAQIAAVTDSIQAVDTAAAATPQPDMAALSAQLSAALALLQQVQAEIAAGQ